METKLQELTQKIYSEGIEKAKSDAAVMIQEAQQTADEIIRKANMEAATIMANAKEQANELKRNSESEIKLASRQAISKLKQQIVDMILVKAVENPVKDALKDKEFIGSLIQKIATNFNNDINLILPESEKQNIADFFNDKTISVLLKGVEISFDPNMKAGFKISPRNDNYIISFTDDDFSSFFKSFMRSRTIQLLYGEE